MVTAPNDVQARRLRKETIQQLMTRSRRVIAILAVSMALCADSVASAAPATKMPVAEMAARLVVRLSENFRFASVAERRIQTRQSLPSQLVLPVQRIRASAEPAPQNLAFSPFQFRLPPPSI